MPAVSIYAILLRSGWVGPHNDSLVPVLEFAVEERGKTHAKVIFSFSFLEKPHVGGP